MSINIKSSPERRRAVGRLARATGLGQDTTELQREVKALALEDHIRALVDAAPVLDQARRERLARLLVGSDQK